MVAAHRSVDTDRTELPGARQQEVGVDLAEAAGLLGVQAVDETGRCGRAGGLTGGKVVVILVTRPVVLSDPPLNEDTRQQVVARREVAEDAVPPDAVELLGEREVGVGAVAEPGVDELVALGVEAVGLQHVERQGVGQVVEGYGNGIVLVGNVGGVLVEFIGVIDVAADGQPIAQVVAQAEIDRAAGVLIVGYDAVAIQLG